MTDINLSLDDIIKKRKAVAKPKTRVNSARGNIRGRGGRGGGISRTRTNSEKNLTGIKNGGVQKRRSSFGKSPRGKTAPLSNVGSWKHDMYSSPNTRRLNSAGNGVNSGQGQSSGKLIISNLEFSVSDNDIRELFDEFGRLLKANVNYDQAGRSRGSAEVVFTNIFDAKRAMNKYNGVPLDGRPMKIELYVEGGQNNSRPITSRLSGVGFSNGRGSSRGVSRGRGSAGRGNFVASRGARTNSATRGSSVNGRGTSARGRAGSAGRGRGSVGRGRGSAGRGRGARGAPRKVMTKEQLDKELDAYSAQNDA